MKNSENFKELEERLDILEDIKKMVDEKCSGFQLTEMISNLPKKFQKTLESHLISVNTAKEFEYNPFCSREDESDKTDFQLFKKFEVFVWNLNKLIDDTKAELRNLRKN